MTSVSGCFLSSCYFRNVETDVRQSAKPKLRYAALLNSLRCLLNWVSPVVARHFKDAGANMVGHWPADDYQHEDSKVLRAAFA